MNEHLHASSTEFPKFAKGPAEGTFVRDNDTPSDLSTDRDSFAERDEKVYIEPRVDGDEWILAQEAFFERFPNVEVPTERVLIEQLESGKLTVDALRKNFVDTEVQYETLAALLRAAPNTGLPIELPPLDSYLAWPRNEQEGFQTVLERGLVKSQHSPWLKQISGRFSSLTELMLSYEHVANAAGISLVDREEDNKEMAA